MPNCGECGKKLIVISSDNGIVAFCPKCTPDVEKAFMKEKTKVVVSKDKKNVTWLQASPVNLVVSASKEKIWIWTCKKSPQEGESVFRMKLVKIGKDWKLEKFDGINENLNPRKK